MGLRGCWHLVPKDQVHQMSHPTNSSSSHRTSGFLSIFRALACLVTHSLTLTPPQLSSSHLGRSRFLLGPAAPW